MWFVPWTHVSGNIGILKAYREREHPPSPTPAHSRNLYICVCYLATLRILALSVFFFPEKFYFRYVSCRSHVDVRPRGAVFRRMRQGAEKQTHCKHYCGVLTLLEKLLLSKTKCSNYRQTLTNAELSTEFCCGRRQKTLAVWGWHGTCS